MQYIPLIFWCGFVALRATWCTDLFVPSYGTNTYYTSGPFSFYAALHYNDHATSVCRASVICFLCFFFFFLAIRIMVLMISLHRWGVMLLCWQWCRLYSESCDFNFEQEVKQVVAQIRHPCGVQRVKQRFPLGRIIVAAGVIEVAIRAELENILTFSAKESLRYCYNAVHI